MCSNALKIVRFVFYPTIFVLLFFFAPSPETFSKQPTSSFSICQPESFGAVGDGIHDDSQAIRLCLAELVSTCPEPEQISSPCGNLKLTQTYFVTAADDPVIDDLPLESRHRAVFRVPSGITIDGGGKVSLESSGPLTQSQIYLFVIGHAYLADDADTKERQLAEGQHIYIENITIQNDLDTKGMPDSENAAIVVYHGYDVHVENVIISDFYRGLKWGNTVASTVKHSQILNSEYIGTAVYASHRHGRTECPGQFSCTNLIENNYFSGSSELAGGIYVNGYQQTNILRNNLTFTHGIHLEDYRNGRVAFNNIRRSPVAIRVGYLNRGARNVLVDHNSISRSTGGIMVGYATQTNPGEDNVKIQNNRIRSLIKLGAAPAIEPPNGWWGYGRYRAGIAVIDSDGVQISGNKLVDLADGTPVGILVTNSRFSSPAPENCYSVIRPDELTCSTSPNRTSSTLNTNNIVTDNIVTFDPANESTIRIGYYFENQAAMTIYGNKDARVSQNRCFVEGLCGSWQGKATTPCTGTNYSPDSTCKRLVTLNHRMYPISDGGFSHCGCSLEDFDYSINEYFHRIFGPR